MTLEGYHDFKVDIEVDERNIIQKLKNQWIHTMPGEYINAEGYWEWWEDTGHGSGIDNIERVATPHEVKIWDAFELIEKLYRNKTFRKKAGL